MIDHHSAISAQNYNANQFFLQFSTFQLSSIVFTNSTTIQESLYALIENDLQSNESKREQILQKANTFLESIYYKYDSTFERIRILPEKASKSVHW